MSIIESQKAMTQLIKHEGQLDLSGPLATVLRVHNRAACSHCGSYCCFDVTFCGQQEVRTICRNCLFHFCMVLNELRR